MIVVRQVGPLGRKCAIADPTSIAQQAVASGDELVQQVRVVSCQVRVGQEARDEPREVSDDEGDCLRASETGQGELRRPRSTKAADPRARTRRNLTAAHPHELVHELVLRRQRALTDQVGHLVRRTRRKVQTEGPVEGLLHLCPLAGRHGLLEEWCREVSNAPNLLTH